MKTTVRIVALLTICLVSFCAFAATSFAKLILVASYGDGKASLANATAAYNDAVDNDTIIFPRNGSATWSSELTVKKPVTINGNGTTLTASGTMNNGFFHITGFTASSLVRITKFTFQMTNWTPQYGIKVDSMTGGCSNGEIRIDQNTFYYGNMQIYFYHCKGLIDNNYFYNGIKAADVSAGSRANADESWNSLVAGTEDAVFFDDNHFIQNASYTMPYQETIGTENGGKLVVRYNIFDGTLTNESADKKMEALGTHGSASGGCGTNGYWEIDSCPRRGQSVVEVYENTIAAHRTDFPISFRGSANLVYNNTITVATGTPRIRFREEEYYETSNWLPLRTAWPAEDQVHNTFIWKNTVNGTQMNTSYDTYFATESNIEKDRDFFLHAPCGASDTTTSDGYACTHGYETFTGANGASGSYPTDGIKYPTKGTMIFIPTGNNAYYKTYTAYRHPHRLASNAPGSPWLNPTTTTTAP